MSDKTFIGILIGRLLMIVGAVWISYIFGLTIKETIVKIDEIHQAVVKPQ